MKTRKIRLVALLVLAAMMIIAIPFVPSAEEPLPANAIQSGQGTLNDSLNLSFRFCSNAELPTVEITDAKGKTVSITVTLVPEFETYLVDGKTVRQYDAVYAGIGPQNITDTFTITVKNGASTLISEEYSALKYLTTLKENNPSDTELLTLIDSVLLYSYESREYLGKDNSAFVTVLQDLDFDNRSLGTAQRNAVSFIVSDGGNKVWSSSCVDTTAQQMTDLSGFMADTVIGQVYTLSFRYKVVSSNGGESFAIGYGDQWRQIGVWKDYSITFICNYKETTHNYIGLNIEGLGSGSANNTVYIDDLKLEKLEVPGLTARAAADFDGLTPGLTNRGVEGGMTAGVDVVSTDLGDGLWKISTAGIAPTDFDKEFTFTVGTSTLTYSVNAYAIAMTGNAKISALTNAMHAYGVAAEAYATIE
ncbi:MAG: hypothetical protein MJ082_00230 [Clostridia bacterium]|nr:hypothetical protein [Clostridia bacterium]